MNTLDHTIDLLAAREIDDAAVQEAQRKLETLIARRQASGRSPLRSSRGWLAAATTAAAVMLAALWLPLYPTPAFAAVQRQLRDFTTMRFVIDQRVAGEPVMQTRVSATNAGNVRTEVGDDVTVIVNSSERRVLTLIRSAHMAIASPLVVAAKQDDALKWLEDVRKFQGVAQALPEPRVINGQQAFGWRLKGEGFDMVLWATEQGLPLEMTLSPDAQLQLEFHFEMNVPLAPELFSTKIPAGYSLAPQED